jgi:hypothetical protein
MKVIEYLPVLRCCRDALRVAPDSFSGTQSLAPLEDDSIRSLAHHVSLCAFVEGPTTQTKLSYKAGAPSKHRKTAARRHRMNVLPAQATFEQLPNPLKRLKYLGQNGVGGLPETAERSWLFPPQTIVPSDRHKRVNTKKAYCMRQLQLLPEGLQKHVVTVISAVVRDEQS